MFGGSTEKRIIRDVDKIVTLKEGVDALSWGRVLDIGKQLQEDCGEADLADLGRELTGIAQANMLLASRLGIDPNPSPERIMASGVEVMEGGMAEAALIEQRGAQAAERAAAAEAPISDDEVFAAEGDSAGLPRDVAVLDGPAADDGEAADDPGLQSTPESELRPERHTPDSADTPEPARPAMSEPLIPAVDESQFPTALEPRVPSIPKKVPWSLRGRFHRASAEAESAAAPEVTSAVAASSTDGQNVDTPEVAPVPTDSSASCDAGRSAAQEQSVTPEAAVILPEEEASEPAFDDTPMSVAATSLEPEHPAHGPASAPLPPTHGPAPVPPMPAHAPVPPTSATEPVVADVAAFVSESAAAETETVLSDVAPVSTASHAASAHREPVSDETQEESAPAKGAHAPQHGAHAAADALDEPAPVRGKHARIDQFSRFRNLYESRDGSLCLFEDEHGHLVAVDSSKLA